MRGQRTYTTGVLKYIKIYGWMSQCKTWRSLMHYRKLYLVEISLLTNALSHQRRLSKNRIRRTKGSAENMLMALAMKKKKMEITRTLIMLCFQMRTF